MDLKSKSNGGMRYRTRLFFLITIFTWILTFSFFTLQYTREKEYKIKVLNEELQLVNNKVIRNIIAGEPIVAGLSEELEKDGESLRVTIFDLKGNVVYDSTNDSITENHSERNEFLDAIKYGSGYTVRRKSSVDSESYFYSATKFNDKIVRSAFPYNNSLVEMLKVDMVYVSVILAIAIFLSIIAWFASRRVGKSIQNLRDFADKAEKGELQNFSTTSFPNDELGEISSYIVGLYSSLEKTTRERDASFKKVIFEEQEKARIKHQLTGNINHELKTPIHAIQACLETIIENKDKLDKDRIIKLVENGYQNAKRLIDLVHDISTITSLSDNSSSIEKTEVDIVPVVNQILEDVEQSGNQLKIRINISMPDKMIVHGNKGLIDAIFRNLINNAISYSGARDMFLELEKETETHYLFKFWDNGLGVAEEHIDRLFERFYRVDDGRSRKCGGTGLGLSIVKNSVLFHNGEITVHNRHNEGLEFVFSLKK